MANVPENFDNCLTYCPRAAGSRDNPERFDAIIGGSMLVQCPGPVVIEYGNDETEAETVTDQDVEQVSELTLGQMVMCGAMYDAANMAEDEDIKAGKAKFLTQQELREKDY